MKTVILSLIAAMSATSALAEGRYIPLVKCNGGEFVIDEIQVGHHGSTMRYQQFVIRHDGKNQELVDKGAVSHSFRGEVIIGGIGSASIYAGEGTHALVNVVYDRYGTPRTVTYYAYPSGQSTMTLDVYEATQTGVGSYRNDRMITRLHFDNCQR